MNYVELARKYLQRHAAKKSDKSERPTLERPQPPGAEGTFIVFGAAEPAKSPAGDGQADFQLKSLEDSDLSRSADPPSEGFYRLYRFYRTPEPVTVSVQPARLPDPYAPHPALALWRVTSPAELPKVLEGLDRVSQVGLDIETTGLKTRRPYELNELNEQRGGG
ncbi:MAG: hypothetical protein RMJ88_16890 [Thermogemmata sp.]|nr:hypothetical protein [Thermogemmata sp.]